MNEGKRSRASLFLMEQIIVIAVFALCAAVCVYIIAASHTMSVNAVDTRYALLMAENTAEAHKAFGGDVNEVAALLGGTALGNRVFVWFCEDWTPVEQANAAFVLAMTQHTVEEDLSQAVINGNSAVLFNRIYRADIAVRRLRDDNVLVSFSTAARNTFAAEVGFLNE